MTVIRFLVSDSVPGALLVLGVPACAFLIAYSATIWRNATRTGTRVPTLAYLLVAPAGMATSVLGELVAAQLSLIAAMNASPDDFSRTPDEVLAATMLLWPLGWALLTGGILAIGRRRLGRPARSVLAALIAGFLSGILVRNHSGRREEPAAGVV